MKYTLITPKGQIFQFFLKAVAEQFLQAYGGTIITAEILVDKTSQTAV